MATPIKVTIGICAYNAQANIKQLIESLIIQKEDDFIIDRIIVHSDFSTDQTVAISKSLNDVRIETIEAPTRRGFAKSFKAVCDVFNSDILIMLNDDIVIKDNNFIKNIMAVFGDRAVGLASGNIIPFQPKRFIEKALASSTFAYHYMRGHMKNKNNKFTCDGKILALSKDFLKKLQFPNDARVVGNVDSFLYFSCLTSGFEYRFADTAVAYYRFPSTILDYIKWVSRNNSNYYMLRRHFGSIVDREYKKPTHLYLQGMLREFIKNPIGSIFIILLKPFIIRKAKKISSNFNPKWDVISTTKDIE